MGGELTITPSAVRLNPTANSDWLNAIHKFVTDAAEQDKRALSDTDPKDRHVLAAAHAAGADLVVSRNIAHFGHADLERMDMSAVYPDLFLASSLSGEGYLLVLERVSSHRSRLSNTPESLHAALGAKHPLLFAAMGDAFPGVPVVSGSGGSPREVFRGVRCLVCGRRLSDPGFVASARDGVVSGLAGSVRTHGAMGVGDVNPPATTATEENAAGACTGRRAARDPQESTI